MDELKPCPFCGSDEITIGSFGSSYVDPQHYVQCEECDGATVRHASESDAVAAWNRRAALAATQAEPIYQVCEAANWWEDVSKEIYDNAHPKFRRIVYAAPESSEKEE